MSLENTTASDQGGIVQWTTGTERKLGREGLSHETFWGNKIAPGTLELDPLERAWVRGRSAELCKMTDELLLMVAIKFAENLNSLLILTNLKLLHT